MWKFWKRKHTTVLELFENLYDPATGLWHAPGWLVEKFDPKRVDEYRQLKAHAAPVEREVADLYRSIVAMTKPHRILETGTNLGYSAYVLASGLLKLGGQRQIFTIDTREGEALFKNTEVDQIITFIKGSSLEFDLSALGSEPFDMLVLDSDHSYGTISGEVNRFAPLLRTGGLMLFHDTMFFDGIALVVRQLMNSPAFEVLNLPTPRHSEILPRCPGLTIARKIAEIEEDIIDRSDPDVLKIALNAPGRNNLSNPLV